MTKAQEVMDFIIEQDMTQNASHSYCVSHCKSYDDIDGDDGLYYVHYYFNDGSVLCTGHGFLSVVL